MNLGEFRYEITIVQTVFTTVDEYGQKRASDGLKGPFRAKMKFLPGAIVEEDNTIFQKSVVEFTVRNIISNTVNPALTSKYDKIELEAESSPTGAKMKYNVKSTQLFGHAQRQFVKIIAEHFESV